MRAGKAWIVASAISVLSCGNPTEPWASVSATVVGQTVARNVDGSVGRVDATFRIAIDNRTADPVYYGGCSVSLEQQDAALRWQNVWSPVCILILPADPLEGHLMIPLGESRDATVHVRAYGDGDEWPSVGLDGTYRLRVMILSPLPDFWRGVTGAQLKSQLLTTNEFTLAPN